MVGAQVHKVSSSSLPPPMTPLPLFCRRPPLSFSLSLLLVLIPLLSLSCWLLLSRMLSLSSPLPLPLPLPLLLFPPARLTYLCGDCHILPTAVPFSEDRSLIVTEDNEASFPRLASTTFPDAPPATATICPMPWAVTTMEASRLGAFSEVRSLIVDDAASWPCNNEKFPVSWASGSIVSPLVPFSEVRSLIVDDAAS